MVTQNGLNGFLGNLKNYYRPIQGMQLINGKISDAVKVYGLFETVDFISYGIETKSVIDPVIEFKRPLNEMQERMLERAKYTKLPPVTQGAISRYVSWSRGTGPDVNFNTRWGNSMGEEAKEVALAVMRSWMLYPLAEKWDEFESSETHIKLMRNKVYEFIMNPIYSLFSRISTPIRQSHDSKENKGFYARVSKKLLDILDEIAIKP